jgi:hypothetical protein
VTRRRGGGHARDLLTRPENTVASIARLLGVSRNTIYKYLPEISSARALPGADIPAQTAPHELIATPATAPAPGPRRDSSCRWSSRAETPALDVLTWLAAAEHDLRAARHALHAAARRARQRGHSWQVIGDQLGISRQAAQQRFGQNYNQDLLDGLEPWGVLRPWWQL